MRDFEKITDLKVKLNRDMVFHMVDCYPDNHVYDIMVEEYNKLVPMLEEIVKPAVYMSFSTFTRVAGHCELNEPAPALYVLVTIGDAPEKASTRFFEEGDYVAGLLMNTMADVYLFQLDDMIQEQLKERCSERQYGIKERLQAPENIPMNVQSDILEELKSCFDLSLGVTSGYMYTTAKTTSYIYILNQDGKTDYHGNQCLSCQSFHCKLRKKTPITILGRDEPHQIQYDGSVSLMEAMLAGGIYFPASCGGRGTCGKCKVIVEKGSLPITASDREVFGEEELQKGYRLSCKAFPQGECTVRILAGDEEYFEVVSEHLSSRKDEVTKDQSSEGTEAEEKTTWHESQRFGIAIDIGTTTLAATLIDLDMKNPVYTHATINRQRAYGADVISRMKASMEGKKEMLRRSIQKDLLESIRSLQKKAAISADRVESIVIAGNTTMGHLLMGYSCETLGIYPFQPVNISKMELSFDAVFPAEDSSEYPDTKVILLPGISTFVGGDITAGLLACGFDKMDQPSLLIDLGTNGEMAIGNKERILVTSTAAGPAFEGGNISCGVGSVRGAISSVTIDEKGVTYDTIGGEPPVGICGTGVVEITSELLKSSIIDETGLLLEEYFTDGYDIATDPQGNKITVTQKDIRELQLAKSAIRAGVEVLIKRYGITYEEIDTVYLAGGFGYKINIEKAVHIGLLPMELKDRIKAVGNSSLAGASAYLTEEDAAHQMDEILKVASEIHLSNDKDFNQLYIDYMYFE